MCEKCFNGVSQSADDFNKENALQLVVQAAHNRNKRVIIDEPSPYRTTHLEPRTLQGITSLEFLTAVFPNPEDRIKVTFDADADLAKLDFGSRHLITWNGGTPRPTVTVPRNSGKFTLGIRGLNLLVSLQ
jgi:hypothetical protein